LDLDEDVALIYGINAIPDRGKDLIGTTPHALVMRLSGAGISSEACKRQLVIVPLNCLTPSSGSPLCQSSVSILHDEGLKWQRNKCSVAMDVGSATKRTAKGKRMGPTAPLLLEASELNESHTPTSDRSTKRSRATPKRSLSAEEVRSAGSAVCSDFVCCHECFLYVI
jgi:hypothetical protein